MANLKIFLHIKFQTLKKIVQLSPIFWTIFLSFLAAINTIDKLKKGDKMQIFKKIVTLRQAAKILGVHVATVDRLIKKGKLPKVRVSYRRIGLLSADLNNYIEQQRGFITIAPINLAAVSV